MNLGTLIDELSKLPARRKVEYGFSKPMSYRGYYDELAFEPARDVTIGSMLKNAKSAVGKTFTGYKGGQFKMTADTPVHLAHYGSTGDPITASNIREWSRPRSD
ncbi:hypothetical protein FA322_08720 [Pseudomonas aeruginosa]|nr:hypothetical protein [Pseudomonas aeruginosa]